MIFSLIDGNAIVAKPESDALQAAVKRAQFQIAWLLHHHNT
jgi:hypothetical protein